MVLFCFLPAGIIKLLRNTEKTTFETKLIENLLLVTIDKLGSKLRSFVTSEKGLVRIKVHDQSGKLISVVAPPNKFNEDGKAAAEQVIQTADKPYSVRLKSDRDTIRAGGKDLSFVTIEIVDKDGNVCPKADNYLFFEVSGTGKLKAVCNGNAIDQTSFSSNYMRAFNGKIVAVIESGDKAGEIGLKVTGGMLKNATLKISTL